MIMAGFVVSASWYVTSRLGACDSTRWHYGCAFEARVSPEMTPTFKSILNHQMTIISGDEAGLEAESTVAVAGVR